MVIHCLVPGMVECEFENECNSRSYDSCTICKNNKIAVAEKKKQKKKKNHFKTLL